MQIRSPDLPPDADRRRLRPGELIALLYDALLRNLMRRRNAGLTVARHRGVAHRRCCVSQDIVLELISSLDTDAEGDVGSLARQLAPLYEYVYRRLLDASLHKDAAPLAEVRRLVQPVREAWAFALEQLAQDAASAARTPREEDRRG
jgi:flagellar secretion chaperone FliS